MKYYSTEFGGYPCQLSYFIELMKGKNKDLFLEWCKRKHKGPMYCWGFETPQKKKDVKCGIDCERYKPCNKKSGRCRSLQRGFYYTHKWFKLTEEGLKKK
jgi:hypothetical protein